MGKSFEYNFQGEIIHECEYNGNKMKRIYKGKLTFDGEYLNGKIWNAKGYDENGNVTYEIKDGKGIKRDYNTNRKLVFEGEYLNGERNGKGKEYNAKGELTFEGEHLNGKRWNGKGKEFHYADLIFEGEYLDGRRWNGIGKEFNEWGREIEFEGTYLNGQKNK